MRAATAPRPSRALAPRARAPRRATVADAARSLADIERAWTRSSYDLSLRWPLTNELCALEIARAELDPARFRVGWHKCKSYVGITYLYDDERDGRERGDVFLSKYVMLDPAFENVVGCVRHELAHAVAGVAGVDHGRAFKDACDALDVPEAWRKATTGGVLQQAERAVDVGEMRRRGSVARTRARSVAGSFVREKRLGRVGEWESYGVQG